MHVTTRQLIACRDGELLDAAIHEHIESCSECRRSLEQLRTMRGALRELPLEQPPADAWARIEAARELERERSPETRWQWAVAASLFAAMALGFTVANFPGTSSDTLQVVETPIISPTATNNRATPTLVSLQDRSQYLEQMLMAVERNSGTVMTLSTAGTVNDLEDGIAAIDYRLSQAGRYPLSETEKRALWQQRIELLESLVTVQYAQARANSI